jgi:hypothetical protein
MSYFSNQFKKQKTAEGKIQYWFTTMYTQDDKTFNEKPPLAVDGGIIYENASIELPEETQNPTVIRQVLEKWIQDCSGCFIKKPTIEQCLANVKSLYDTNAPIATLSKNDITDYWIFQWIPTRIKVDFPQFEIYWSPSYKLRMYPVEEESKIPLNFELNDIEVQQPEKIYSVRENNTRLITTKDTNSDSGWLQEINDLPFSDSPALRLDAILEDSQREKYRKRVREARIRAKLAKYRAERLAQRYEDKYGVYPEEDAEEAQTEVEQSDED